ncbi:MAG: Ig-like domain-containing protein [archaeon]|nr:Ig-like domain-containing protein [archaeon]
MNQLMHYTIAFSLAIALAAIAFNQLPIQSTGLVSETIFFDACSELTADNDTTFLAHFNNTAIADFGLGNKNPTETTGTTFVEGKCGQAIQIDSADRLSYYGTGNVASTEEGTIEFWVQPKWNGDDGLPHTLIMLGENTYDSFHIKKWNYASNNNLSAFSYRPSVTYPVNYPVGNWTTNSWHHVAATWKNGANASRKLYVDGILVSNISVNYSSSYYAFNYIPAKIRVGWGTIGVVDVGNVVIDELRISKKERTESEIRMSAGLSQGSGDTESPIIQITQPYSAAQIQVTTSSIVLGGTATDNIGIAQITWLNTANNSSGTATFNSTTGTWGTAAIPLISGNNTIIVTANDAAGNQSSDTVTVISIYSPPPIPDTQLPSVAITSPVNGAIVSSPITITATASDNVGVTKVRFFYYNGNLIGEDTTAPYSVQWTTGSTGSRQLYARAYDAAGNEKTSETVNITISSTPQNDATPPTVSITFPANNATISGTINITTSFTAGGETITKVEFFDGTTLLGGDTSSPYTYTLNTINRGDGPHTLTAKITDASGDIATSAPINITIDNTPADTTPPAKITSLYASNPTANSVKLSWNAVGDDGETGTATTYDIRYSNSQITNENDWQNATQAINEPAPAVSGIAETFTVTGLSSSRSYFFAIKTADEKPNWSLFSNIATASTTNTYDIQNPVVVIGFPALATYTYTSANPIIVITGTATDNIGVTQVTWSNNRGGTGNAIGIIDWSANVSLQPGENIITFTAKDAANNIGTDSVTITYTPPENTSCIIGSPCIINGCAGICRTNNVCEDVANDNCPLEPVQFNLSLAINVSPFTEDGIVQYRINATALPSLTTGIQKTEFFSNEVLKSTDQSSPYTSSWVIPRTNASYIVSAKATHESGSTAQASKNVTVNGGIISITDIVVDIIAPTVSITSPVNGLTIQGPMTSTVNGQEVLLSNLIINASALDNVGVTKVEFFDGTIKLGSDETSPYSIEWKYLAASNGSHNLTAKAYDAAGNIGQSQTVNIILENMSSSIDNVAPTLSISASALPYEKGEPLLIKINATTQDNVAIKKVEFYVNNNFKLSDEQDPYTYNWNTDNYPLNVTHNIKVKVYDNSLNSVERTITIRLLGGANVIIGTQTEPINNVAQNPIIEPVNDIIPPQLSFFATKLAFEKDQPTRIRFDAIVSDNAAIKKVEFYVNNILKSSDSQSPYSYVWNTQSYALNQEHIVKAKVFDNSLNSAETTISITLEGGENVRIGAQTNTTTNIVEPNSPQEINEPANDTVSPSITITSPQQNELVASTINARVNASDNVGIVKVEYSIEELSFTKTQSPFNIAIDTENLSNGTHTLYAKAFDAKGNTQRTSVRIVVNKSKTNLDKTQPTSLGLKIVSPTQNSNYSVFFFPSTISLSGTALLENEISEISWKTNKGWQGKAKGKQNWASTNIKLFPGNNEITVTAIDSLGNSASDKITVNYVCFFFC